MIQLPKQIGTRLGKNPDSVHPDPDLLTAFIENSLAGIERDSILSHLVSCPECRQIIVLAAPSSPVEVGQRVPPNRTAWSFSPVLRWGTVFASIVVVATAIVVYRTSNLSRGQTAQVAILDKTLPTASPAQADDGSKRLVRHIPGGNTSSETGVRPGLAKTPHRTNQLASASPPPAREYAVPAGSSSGAEQKDNSAQARNEDSGTASGAISDQAAGDRDEFARNSVAAKKAAPVFTPRPTAETAASTIGGAAKLNDFRPPAWRLSNDGFPERSFTPGVWEKVEVDHHDGFHAISANGMEVWVGGSGGALYHSEDVGLNWTRMIPVSGDTTLSDDVTSITFTDHLHGQFRTASGQNWVTVDAGKSWTIR